MPSYQYNAIRMSDRTKTKGLINADNERQARELLREQELIPTSMEVVKSVGEAKGSNIIKKIMLAFKGIGSKEIIAFSRNIGLMVRNGIPVTDALLYFENYLENPKLKAVINQIRKDIVAGFSFSQALSKHPKLFNDIYINVTRAGETSGELDVTMGRMTDLLIRAEKIKMTIISTSIYPAVILGIVGIVLLLIFLVVLPTFVDIYEQMGVELPLITQIMVLISDILRNWWFITFPAIGASLFGIFKWIQSASGKRIIDFLLLKIPVVNEVTLFSNASQFVSTLSVSFSAGIPITDALILASETVDNHIIRRAYTEVNTKIQAGQRLGVALADTGYVPDLVLLMLATGEESGDLDRMLSNSHDYLEEEINHKIEILTSFLEPVMLMVLGVIVGAVALGIYLPLFGLYENI